MIGNSCLSAQNKESRRGWDKRSVRSSILYTIVRNIIKKTENKSMETTSYLTKKSNSMNTSSTEEFVS